MKKIKDLRNSLRFAFMIRTKRTERGEIMAGNVIEIKNLEKQYMKNKVIKDVSFEIKEGSIVGLIGPNGAGKTTIMKMMGGLVIPTGGSISIYGKSDEKDLVEARGRMSFMIETPYAKENLSAKENLEKNRLQKGIPNKEIVDEILKTVGLDHTGKKMVKNFSLGMKQRLGIGTALMSKPEIMVLDEPINGLDPEGIVEIRELLLKLNREKHMTIIISSHILSELSLLCTDYVFIHHGEIIKKITSEELSEECKQYYRIHTDNDPLALTCLQEKLDIKNVDVAEDGSIRLYEKLNDIKTVSKTLFESGVIPLELGMNEANLEAYYMQMVADPKE